LSQLDQYKGEGKTDVRTSPETLLTPFRQSWGRQGVGIWGGGEGRVEMVVERKYGEKKHGHGG
jgi:hypothetical protein